jgi:hypothetical protein
MMTLIGHSLRRWRPFLTVAAVVLIVLQLFITLAARSLETSGGFLQLGGLMPQFLEQWTNMMAISFRGFVLFGYSHPLVELFLVAMAIGIATEPAAEVELRVVDVMLSRPVRREAVIGRSVVVLIVAVAIAMSCMLIGTWLGLWLFAPAGAVLPEPRVVLSLAVNLALVVLAWGGIAMAIGAGAKRRAAAASICGFLAFASFVLDYVGRFWSAVAGVSRISPFHYFSPFAMIGGQRLALADVAALLVAFVAGSSIAAVIYARRDL